MKTSKAEQTARRAVLLQHVVAGHTYAQIKRDTGLSTDTIGRDLKAIGAQLERWAAEQQNRALASAIAQYQRVIDQAWADHEADAENERKWLGGEFAEQTQVPDPVDGARIEKRTQQQFRSQKSDYLRVIVQATQQLCKLAGLEAATRVDVRQHVSMGGQLDVHHSYEPERPERVLDILTEAGIIAVGEIGATAAGAADDAQA